MKDSCISRYSKIMIAFCTASVPAADTRDKSRDYCTQADSYLDFLASWQNEKRHTRMESVPRS